MRKRIIAFYDVLLFAIICSPMIVTAVILSFVLVTKGTSEWIYENWYLVLIFAITFMVPIGGTLLFRYCVINNNLIHFHYFPFTTSRKKAANNIDVKWNQNVFISEIKDIEPMRIENDRQREAKYKEALVSCDCKQLICIIKTMYARNKERIGKGKRITYVDDRYLKEAKQNLNDEFSIALGIEPREVEKYIKAQIVEQEA